MKVNVFCSVMGMKLSTRCTDGPSILDIGTPSIVGMLRVFWYSESQYEQCCPTDEILPILVLAAVPTVQNPKILDVQGVSTCLLYTSDAADE